MKRIKFKLPVIVALTLLVLVGFAGFYGCSGDDNALQPTTQGAAQNLHERFAELFEENGNGEEYGANETVLEPAIPAVVLVPPPPPTTTALAEVDSGIIAGYDYNYDDEYVEIENLDVKYADIAENACVYEESEESEELTEPLELFAITPTGQRFHLEHCHHARNASELLTREAAEARGLTPCGTCRP